MPYYHGYHGSCTTVPCMYGAHSNHKDGLRMPLPPPAQTPIIGPQAVPRGIAPSIPIRTLKDWDYFDLSLHRRPSLWQKHSYPSKSEDESHSSDQLNTADRTIESIQKVSIDSLRRKASYHADKSQIDYHNKLSVESVEEDKTCTDWALFIRILHPNRVVVAFNIGY